jgi:Na+-transporting NADH:ubiquinone oxidoreductase subunit NqrC
MREFSAAEAILSPMPQTDVLEIYDQFQASNDIYSFTLPISGVTLWQMFPSNSLLLT